MKIQISFGKELTAKIIRVAKELENSRNGAIRYMIKTWSSGDTNQSVKTEPQETSPDEPVGEVKFVPSMSTKGPVKKLIGYKEDEDIGLWFYPDGIWPDWARFGLCWLPDDVLAKVISLAKKRGEKPNGIINHAVKKFVEEIEAEAESEEKKE